MITVTIHEAKTNLSPLIAKALERKEVIVAKAGTPLVRLATLGTSAPRLSGQWKGKLQLREDFDVPLEEIQFYFDGEA